MACMQSRRGCIGTRGVRWLARGRVPDRGRGCIPRTCITTGEIAVIHAAQKEAGTHGVEEQHVACRIGQRGGTGHTGERTIEDTADDGADEDNALVDEVVVGLAGGARWKRHGLGSGHGRGRGR